MGVAVLMGDPPREEEGMAGQELSRWRGTGGVLRRVHTRCGLSFAKGTP